MQITPYPMNWNWTDSVVSLATSPWPAVPRDWKQVAAKIAAAVAYYTFIPLAYLWLVETIGKGGYSLASRCFGASAPQNNKQQRSVRFASSPTSTAKKEEDGEVGGQSGHRDAGDAQSLYAGPLHAKMLGDEEESRASSPKPKKKDPDEDSDGSLESIATAYTYVTGGAHSAILDNDHFNNDRLPSSSSSSSSARPQGQKRFRVCLNNKN